MALANHVLHLISMSMERKRSNPLPLNILGGDHLIYYLTYTEFMI